MINSQGCSNRACLDCHDRQTTNQAELTMHLSYRKKSFTKETTYALVSLKTGLEDRSWTMRAHAIETSATALATKNVMR